MRHASYPPDEIAARFQHRLVAIHCFVHGNGRHARLVAYLLALALGRCAFAWGSGDLAPVGEVRAAYITALRQADQHDHALLLSLARS